MVKLFLHHIPLIGHEGSKSECKCKKSNGPGYVDTSVADPYVFGPPGSESIGTRYESGSGSFYQNNFLLPSWRSLTKIAGSGSGLASQGHGSADPDPDPYQNVTDPQHWSTRKAWCTWKVVKDTPLVLVVSVWIDAGEALSLNDLLPLLGPGCGWGVIPAPAVCQPTSANINTNYCEPCYCCVCVSVKYSKELVE